MVDKLLVVKGWRHQLANLRENGSLMFLSRLVLSYRVASIVSLAFEAPMMAIEKIIFKREKQN